MAFQGYADQIANRQLIGWAWDSAAAQRRLELFVWINGHFHGRVLANQPRADLVRKGVGDGRYAFAIAIPPRLADGRPHHVRIADAAGREPAGSPFAVHLTGPRLADANRVDEAEVTLLAIAKNERSYIEEWVAHHHAIGFRRIVVYDNDSSDGTADALRGNPRLAGLVEVIPWPASAYGADQAPQYAAYDDALRRLDRRGWVAVLDLDKFLVLRHDRTVQQLLARYSDLPALSLCWRLFGSGGQDRYAPGPVTRRFRYAGSARFAKSISRLDVAERLLCHAPVLRDALAQDELRRPIPDLNRLVRPSYRHAQINHYFCKSREEWERKRQRGRAARPQGSDSIRDPGDFARHDVTEATEDTIARHWPGTLDSMARLFPDALDRWHAAGVLGGRRLARAPCR